MTLKKFVSLMFAMTLVLALGCGKGKEAASNQEEGEDDQAGSTAAASNTAGTAAPSATPAAAAVVSADAATLNGTVKLDGTAPKMAAIQMSADPYCQSQHPNGQGAEDEEVIVGPAGELANVLVYVKNAPNGPAPTTPATIDQKGCRYYPHVQAVVVNQPIQIKNDDATLHNIHSMSTRGSDFNVGQPLAGQTFDGDRPVGQAFDVVSVLERFAGAFGVERAVVDDPDRRLVGRFRRHRLPGV